MSDSPILSPIIPVYRIEAYLRECLASVASQTLRDIEVIVVNDGSPDQSQSIINAYCAVFENFSFVETTNQEQSIARNLGLDRASGAYVTFLDSDDRLPLSAYQALVTVAEQTRTDVCVGVADSFAGERTWVNPQMAQLYSCRANHATLPELPLLVRDASPCNKIFRRELLEQGKLRFPEGIGIRKDMHPVLRALAAAKSISVIPAIIYHYRAREDREDRENVSQTELIESKVFEDLIWVARDLHRLLGNVMSAELLHEKDRAYLEYTASRLPRFIASHTPNEQDETLGMIAEYLGEILPSLIDELGAGAEIMKQTLAGNFDVVRRLAPQKEELRQAEKRPKPLRKKLKRMQRDATAQVQEVLAELQVPSKNKAVSLLPPTGGFVCRDLACTILCMKLSSDCVNRLDSTATCDFCDMQRCGFQLC